MRITPLVFSLFLGWLCALCVLMGRASQRLLISFSSQCGPENKKGTETAETSALVIYSFSPPSESAERGFRFENLKFFLRHAVSKAETHAVTYRVTLNGYDAGAEVLLAEHNVAAEASENERTMPSRHMPPVHRLQRRNRGYDFASYKDSLDAECVRNELPLPLSKCIRFLPYSIFIFLNDGIRGPFLPVYFPQRWHWTSIFLGALENPKSAANEDSLDTRWSRMEYVLVGASLVCLPSSDYAVVNRLVDAGPKVEGFAFAITKDALIYTVLDGSAFRSSCK